MSEKLYFLITFVLVLTLSGIVRAEPNDANLIGWWKFDEAEGNTVEDSSGYDNHGFTNVSDPVWVPGHPGDPCDSAMDFDGRQDYVICAKRDGNGPGEYPEELMPEKFTIACWTRLDNFTYYGGFVSNGYEDERCGFFLNNGGNAWNFGISMMTNDWWDVETPSSTKYLTHRWHHLAATYDGTTAIVYVNGEIGFREEGIGGPIVWETSDGNYPSNFVIGTWIDEGYAGMDDGLPVDGVIDDVRFYNYAMDLNDIRILAGIVPGAACNPSPAYGQRNASMYADLTWTPGSDWARHDVYFGTDKDAVTDANTVVQLGVYMGQQDANFVSNSSLVPALELDNEYFWRVDEVNDSNGAMIKGTIWNFKVANYIIIDDMESYPAGGGPEAKIEEVWFSDWYTSTAEIFLQTEDGDIDYVHDEEGQSMEYKFRNSESPYLAEAVRTFDRPGDVTDWTTGNVEALVLYFRADKANPPDAVQPMYVSVSDGPHTATVKYHDSNDLIGYKDGWQEWNIDLQEFTGVNLEDITEMSIKIGDGNETGEGEFFVYFDDIRLYLVRCVPEISHAYGDFTGEYWWTGDCNVDALDLEWMTYDWLASDYNIMVSAPNDANLIGWWKFDEGDGDTVEDSSIYDNDGSTTNPDPDWVDGYPNDPCDSAMWFDGLNPYYLTCALDDPPGTYPPELMPDIFTIALWTKLNTFSEFGAFITNGIDGEAGFYLWNTDRGEGIDDEGTFSFSMRTEPGWQDVDPPDIYETETWYHLAVTYDGNYANFYVDGVLEAGPQDVNGPMRWIDEDSGNYPPHFIIGSWEDPVAEWSEKIHGTIDEVRYYNYALPHGEVAYLAGLEGEQYVPLEAYTNILPRDPDPEVDKQYYPLNPDVVNFTDFAVLADNWLNQILFP